MAGQTESLSVPSEEPATQQAGGEGCAEEEVVASVETGEPNSNFIITAASDDSMEGDKLAKNVESEAVGVIEEEEERPAEIEDEFASNDNVAEETVEETPMETEDIPRRVEEISETAIQEEESMAETNIPEEMNTEDPPKEEVENKPVSNIPDEISNKEETSSVQEQEPSKPDDNSSEVFHREEQPETATESPDPPPYSSSILKNVVESTITTEPTITTR